MAYGSDFFGGAGFTGGTAAAAADAFGGGGFASDPVLTGVSDALASQTFGGSGGGGGGGDILKYLLAGLQGASQAQKTQQPSYQSMVPPQSMTMQPQMQPRTSKHPTSLPTMGADNLLAAAARSKLSQRPKEEESSVLGPLLGAAGGIAGLALGGGSAGAGIGSKIGGMLGNMVG